MTYQMHITFRKRSQERGLYISYLRYECIYMCLCVCNSSKEVLLCVMCLRRKKLNNGSYLYTKMTQFIRYL